MDTYILFIYSQANGHLGRLQFLAIVKNATMNKDLCGCMFSSLLGISTQGVELLAHLLTLSLTL